MAREIHVYVFILVVSISMPFKQLSACFHAIDIKFHFCFFSCNLKMKWCFLHKLISAALCA